MIKRSLLTLTLGALALTAPSRATADAQEAAEKSKALQTLMIKTFGDTFPPCENLSPLIRISKSGIFCNHDSLKIIQLISTDQLADSPFTIGTFYGSSILVYAPLIGNARDMSEMIGNNATVSDEEFRVAFKTAALSIHQANEEKESERIKADLEARDLAPGN